MAAACQDGWQRLLALAMLYRAFATVGGLTMVSRLLGFARDILIAAALGSGAIADAFFVAFRFPNLFRRLFGEGAFNAAFVPLFARRLEGEGPEAARTFAEEALAGLAFVLAVFSVIAVLAMPWLMVVLAPGFLNDPVKFDLAVLLTQIAFPYLFCMSLVALLSGVLNSLHRFWAAAAAPILLNIVLISAILLAIGLGYGQRPEAGIVLAAGVFVAGLAQLAMLWIAVRRAGVKLSLRWPVYTPGVQRLVHLGIPGLISGGITQINIVVGTIIASLQAGAVSHLYYADRLYQLPLGIVGVAIGVVLLPDLARRLRAGEHAAAMDSQNRSLEFGLLITLPAAVALGVAAEPIVRVLFERGAFRPEDTPATAHALAAFAIGLPGFVLIKVFQPGFFAREDTRTPMYFAVVNMALNVAGSIGLFFLFREWGLMPHVGIALATTIAGWTNAALLWIALAEAGHFRWDARLARNLPLIALASAAMGGAIHVALPYLAPYLSASAPLSVQFGTLVGLVAAGCALYAAMILGTGVMSLRQLRSYARRRPPG
ncbi:MAG: murein biosynthesis integral membrane protein MurJ [Hyphomicrobiaceae bacterium]|nr:murein biosynthesis integral membrane protein MurJ [Hyphomicrobiaceae bacterium]